MLSGAFTTIGRYWKPLIGMALTLFGAATLVMIVALVVAASAVASEWDELTSGSPGPRTRRNWSRWASRSVR